MADKKAEISGIDLRTADINLDDEQIQISPYTGFNKKNSLYLGGQLKNWYKDTNLGWRLINVYRDVVEKAEGRTTIVDPGYIQLWNNHVIWDDGDGNIYKDSTRIYSGSALKTVKPVASNWTTDESLFGDGYIRCYCAGNLRAKLDGDNNTLYFANGSTTSVDSITTEFEIEAFNAATVDGATYVSIFSPDRLTVVTYQYNSPDTDHKNYYWTKVDGKCIIGGATLVDAEPWTTTTTTYRDLAVEESEPETSSSYELTYKSMHATAAPSSTWSTPHQTTFTYSPNHINSNNETSFSKKWNRGKKILVNTDAYSSNVYVLYYNGEQTGISVGDTLVVDDIDHILHIDKEAIYYYDSNENLKKLSFTRNVSVFGGYYHYDCQPILKNKYLVINNIAGTTIDLETNKVFNRSNDYNDRLAFYWHPEELPDDVDMVYKYIATGINEQAEIIKDVWCAGVYAPSILRIPSNWQVPISDVYDPWWTPSGYNKYDVNVYLSTSSSLDTPAYLKTIRVYENYAQSIVKTNWYSYITTLLIGRDYPMGNVLYPVAAATAIEDAYLNYALFDDGNNTYISQTDQSQNMLFAYYSGTFTGLSDLFVIQGTIYGITDNNYIVAMTLDANVISSIRVVCSKGDFKFIGSTPYNAFFWSPLDRSIYSFTGDMIMSKVYDCNSISEIYFFNNNPSNGLIVMGTNVGLVVLYDNQLCILDTLNYDGYSNTNFYAYYTGECICVDQKSSGTTLHLYRLSPYKRTETYDDFEAIPVIAETKFYGAGSELKSVNDTVYIRLFSENNEKTGNVKVWCETMNEKSVKSNEKTYVMNDTMFDYNGMAYIRYQPKFQSATGFRVHVESDFSIVSISIGHKAETIQNSSINL